MNEIKFIFKIFFLFFLLFDSAIPQRNNIFYYNVNDGLSNNNINVIYQSKKGFIWAGTESGLNRFDGYEFKNFRSSIFNKTSLSHNYIISLTEDYEGYFWILTKNGLNRFDPKTNVFNYQDCKFQINSFSIQKDRIIWIASDSGLFKYDIYNKKLNKISIDNIYDLNKIDQIQALEKYIIFSINNTFYILDPFNLNFKSVKLNSSENSKVISFYTDYENYIWIPMSDGKLLRYYLNANSLDDLSSIKNNSSLIVNHIIEDGNRNLWFTTNNGLFNFNKSNQNFQKISNYDQSDKKTSSIFIDFSSNLWFGIENYGLVKMDIKPKTFQLSVNISKYNLKKLNFIENDNFNNILIGTDKGLLRVIADKNKYFSDKSSIQNLISEEEIVNYFQLDEIYSLVVSHSKFIIVNLSEKEFKIEKSLQISDLSSSDNFITSAYLINQNKLIFSTNNNNVYQLNIFNINNISINKINLSFPFNSKLTSIKKIIYDQNNNLWFATNNSNVFIYRFKEDKLINLSSKFSDYKNNIYNNINNLYEDPNGFIWVCTQDGLIKVNVRTLDYEIFDDLKNLQGNNIYTASLDNMNNLWTGTNLGISKINLNLNKIKNYNTDNGLNSMVYYASKYFKKTNILVFASNSDLTIFNPNEIRDNPYIPRLAVSGMTIFKQGGNIINIESDFESINLNYDDIFSIQFASLEFTNSSNNYYSYRIPEINTNWISLKKRRQMPVLQLSPGSYTLEMIGSNNDGNWTQFPLKINIDIGPPFWGTTWFRVLLGVIIALIVFTYLQISKKKVEKQNVYLESQVNLRTKKIEEQKEELSILFEVYKESEDKFRSIFENANVGIFRITDEGKIILINPTLLRMLGFSSLDKSSQLILESKYFSLNKLNFLSDYFHSNNLFFNQELEWFTESGNRVVLRENIKRIFKASENKHYYDGVIEDVTQEALAKEKINKYIDDLEELNKTKDKLFSIIAHDLRNPLSVLISTSDLINRRIDVLEKEKLIYFINSLYTSSKQLDALLENLLDWGRSQLGKVTFNPKDVNVKSMIANTLQIYSNVASQKNIKLTNLATNDIIGFIDEKMINTVIRNLINNSIKFTNPGGNIIISAEEDPNNIYINISDNGVGMNEETINKLFKLNVTTSSRGTANEKGTGLGLIICKEFIEKHKGSIKVTSEIGKGSLFSIHIPKNV